MNAPKLTLRQGDNDFGSITVEISGRYVRVYRYDEFHHQYVSILPQDCPSEGGCWFSHSDISYVCAWRALGGRLSGQIREIVQPYLEEQARLDALGAKVEVAE